MPRQRADRYHAAAAVSGGAFAAILLLPCALAVACSTEHGATQRRAPATSSARSVASATSAEPVAAQPQPDLRLLISTDLNGTLEPCGCTADQLGGLDHLAAALAAERNANVPTLYLSAGDLFSSRASEPRAEQAQEQWRADTLAEILRELRVDAAGMGSHDLTRGHAALATWADHAGFSFISSGFALERAASQNLTTSAGIAGAALEPVKSSQLSTVGKHRVGIVGALARPPAGWPAGVHGADDAVRSALAEIAKLRARGADLIVALSDATSARAEALSAANGADFMVVSGDGAPGATRCGKAWSLRAAPDGQGLLVVDVWLDAASGAFFELPAPSPGQRSFRARYRALPADAPRDAAVRSLIDQLNARIHDHNQLAYADDLPRAVPRDGAGYVGARPCAACHTAEYVWWLSSPHGRAYASLVSRGKEYDLECVGCHVTGYREPGGSTLTHVGELKNVGCESCHGAGSTHIVDARPPHRFIKRSVGEGVCRKCHDREHSHAFDYTSYLSKLRARGHGLPLGP